MLERDEVPYKFPINSPHMNTACDGCLKMRESLCTRVIVRIETILSHIDMRAMWSRYEDVGYVSCLMLVMYLTNVNLLQHVVDNFIASGFDSWNVWTTIIIGSMWHCGSRLSMNSRSRIGRKLKIGPEILQPNIRLETLCDNHVAYILGEISVILVKESGAPLVLWIKVL